MAGGVNSAPIEVRLTTAPGMGGPLATLRAKLRDLSPAVSQFPAAVRGVVAQEFAEQSWFSPAGKVPWKPRHAFGTRSAGGRTLVESGRYFAALQGGPGSIERVGANRCSIGVSGQEFPQAAMLRGGAGGEVSDAPFLIKPVAKSRSTRARWAAQWSMFWAIGFRFGVWLKDETLRRGLEIHPRPHMTDSPQLRQSLRAMVLRHLLGAT